MHMTDRDAILARLRQGRGDLGADPAHDGVTRPVARIENESPHAVLDLFVTQAEALQCYVTVCATASEGVQAVLGVIGDDTTVAAWDRDHIPLPELHAALADADITATQAQDPALRVGLTGADAAIAATGSLVLATGLGKPRHVSLLPDVHIAVIRRAQIVPTMEAWGAAALADDGPPFAASSQVIVVSGASRTADIGMELVLGAHGPRELHVIILP
jgi:L-lactate dehydrogenase complex protein LldG